MTQYNVTGMTCAACSARVEKAVGKVAGVTSCSVSLLTNSMGVEGNAKPADIIKAVTDAGYGASLKGAEKAASDDSLKDTETPKLLKRLIWSLGFCPCVYGRQPCHDGAFAADSDRDNNGYKPAVLCQRF